ncbi:hypothetical protein GE061_005741 [Apolygus lucorum]|uniref:Uncharacterized protein n=1 Tax=Apolygus lucorum TaxID=248454 RepID=A0A6A4J408_APOLU|nr:hypothetical protein GE061_005741 [Apolygus lucorum]
MVAQGGTRGGLPDVALDQRHSPTDYQRKEFISNQSSVVQAHTDITDGRPETRSTDQIGSVGIDYDEDSENEDFYIGSLDEDSFKEALEEFAKSDSKALVITNTAKKYITQYGGSEALIQIHDQPCSVASIGPRILLTPDSPTQESKSTGNSSNSRRFSLNPKTTSIKEQNELNIQALRRFSLKSSRSSSPSTGKSSSISERRFSLRAASSKSKVSLLSANSNKSSGSSTSSKKKVSRTHLVKRNVKTPDGKKKTEYAFVYDKSVHNLHHDQKWQQETSLGKRVALYRLQGELGRGNFSTVKLGIHELTKERVAVKILDKSKLTPKARKMLVREIASMEAVHHKNIIR